MHAEALFVGDVARACGVSVDTIRHYEKKGVITGVTRDRSGYRRYPHETLSRVRGIRRAIALGFSLDDLARIFRLRAAGRPPCREVRELAAKKLEDVEAQIAELVALRSALQHTIDGWDERIASAGNGAFANLLTALSEGENIR